jgi:hypothetical protein
MSDSSAPSPKPVNDPPRAIPVGILVDAGPSIPRRHRPVRHGRLAPPCSMILEVPDPVIEPQRATNAEAWWLLVENKPPPTAGKWKKELHEEPASWKPVLVWSIFAGVIMVGVITGGLMAAQSHHANRNRLHPLAIEPSAPARPVARMSAAVTVQEVFPAQPSYVAPITAMPPDMPAERETQAVTQESTPPEPPKPIERPAHVAVEPPAQCAVGGDGRYGTSVDFVADPAEAGKKAIAEKKLLFVLNISGNFEDDKFT